MLFSRILLLFALVVTENVWAQQLYDLNGEKLAEAREYIITLPDGGPFQAFKEEFINAAQEAHRGDVDLTEVLLNRVKSFCFTLRQPGVVIPASTVHTLDDLRSLMYKHFAEHFSHEWKGKTDSFEKGIVQLRENLGQYATKYYRYIERYGTLREWRFRSLIDPLINSNGESKEGGQKDCDQTLLHHLISIGFIKPKVPLTEGFIYQPDELVRIYLDENPLVSRLVLGCGHHLSATITSFLEVPHEAYCAACELTDFHDGDLTIALLSGDLSDIVADMHDPILWEALKMKRWEYIADHSWGASFDQEATLKAIYDALDDHGLFEVWGGDSVKNSKASDVGFKVAYTDEKRHLVCFKK